MSISFSSGSNNIFLADGDLLPDLIDTEDIPQDDPLMEELLIWEEKMKAVMVHLDKFVKSFEENMKNSNKMMDALEIDGKDSKESANSEADDEDDENLALYSENYSLIPGEILALDEAANGDDYAPY